MEDKNMSEEDKVGRDLRMCESMFQEAQKNRAHWEPIVKKVMPELLESADMETSGHRVKKERICGHAQMDVLKLASAIGTYITPMGQKWFQYTPWYEQELDEDQWADEASWYSKGTEIVHSELNKSNFYTELYATNIDFVITGTGLLLGEGDSEKPLSFTHVPVGTYALAENAEHEVNTVVRKFKMTAAQLVDCFGEDSVSEKTRANYRDERRKYSTADAHTVYHLVEPNFDGIKAWAALPSEERPFRSVYIDVTDKQYLREDGYYEFPYFAPRFSRYGNSPYGRSSLAGVIDDIRDLISLKYFNFINAQKKTMPPVLVSAEIEGEVDMRAGGQTVVSLADAQAGLPREWATAGDIRDALEQIEELKQNIDNATFVNIIQAITQQGKTMTATEVNAIESEKILTFSPTFMQYVTDYRPMNDRIFCINVRQGKLNLDDAPEGVVKNFSSKKTGGEYQRIIPPDVSYIGRMAQTIQQVQQGGLNSILQELVAMFKETGSQEWLYVLNPERIARWKINAAAVPTRCTNSPEEVRNLRAQAQAQAQAQLQAELAEQASVTERNIAQARQ